MMQKAISRDAHKMKAFVRFCKFQDEKAPLILVVEQPLDQEDQLGMPFIGPAGQLLRTICAELGINPEDIYLTNASNLNQTPIT